MVCAARFALRAVIVILWKSYANTIALKSDCPYHVMKLTMMTLSFVCSTGSWMCLFSQVQKQGRLSGHCEQNAYVH